MIAKENIEEINIDNDFIFIFNSSINNINDNGVVQFCTDSNWLEMIERDVNNISNNHEKILKNFYPFSTCISIRDYNDKNNKITLFTERPQLGSGLFKGNIILLLNRKTNYYTNEEKMLENEPFNNENLKIIHLIFFGNNPFSYNNPSKTENFLNFIHNFLNRAFLIFKIINYESEKKYFYQYNSLKENLENYILISDCIRTNYQLINKNIVLGEYFKFHMEYFHNYEKSGKNKYTNKEGIISLRFLKNQKY